MARNLGSLKMSISSNYPNAEMSSTIESRKRMYELMGEQSKKVLAVSLMEGNGYWLDNWIQVTLTTQMAFSEKHHLQQSILSLSN